jgi:hypothetical protein
MKQTQFYLRFLVLLAAVWSMVATSGKSPKKVKSLLFSGPMGQVKQLSSVSSAVSSTPLQARSKSMALTTSASTVRHVRKSGWFPKS